MTKFAKVSLIVAGLGLAMLAEEAVKAQSGPLGAPRRTRPGTEQPIGRPAPGPGPGARVPDAPADLPKIETKSRQPIRTDQPLFTSDTNVVSVDIAVLNSDGIFIPGIPAGNFQVLEDGVPQRIVNIGASEAPMTVCLLVEFSALYQNYWTETWYQTLTAAYGFVETLRPEDWVAVVAYDLKPEILSDFTQDRRETQAALQRLRIPGYSESNLFDAVAQMCERMKDIEGRKSIVVISSGDDTFSKLTFKKARETIQDAGVTVHSIGMMQALREYLDSRGYLGGIQRMNFLQADLNLKTFSKETGGISFFPRFFGEFPNIFRSLAYVMRNQYVAEYQPTNAKRDGTRRKIEVRLVDPATNNDLRITGQKGKRVKYSIVHKEGYVAPREVE